MESNCAKHGLVSSKMLLTRTKSAKCTLGPGYNAADNLSVTLRTNCPFGFGLRHFAADHKIRTPFVVLIGGGQNVRHQQKEEQDRKLGPWYNVADIFSATLPKSELHFAFLVFKDAFCTFEPLQQRGVQNAIHVKRVRASA